MTLPVPNVPQALVAGHGLARGLVSGSQLVVLQVTAPGVPDLPAPTPHFVAHPLGSACFQMPNSAGGLNNLSTKHLDKRPNIKIMGAHSNDRVSMCWWIGEEFVMVASDDGAGGGGGGSVYSRLPYQYRTYHNPRF